ASSPGSCRASVRTTWWAPWPSPPARASSRIRPRAARRSRPSCRHATTPIRTATTRTSAAPCWPRAPSARRPSRPRSHRAPPGTSLVELPYRFRAQGEFLLRARLILPPGQPRAPAPAGVPITVTPPARVLLVSELARPVVALALTRRGADVDVVQPAALASYLA